MSDTLKQMGTLLLSPILKRNSNSVCAPTKMTLHRKTPGKVLMRV
jgi:hypothetical protein